ncbi:MAG: ABC transporter permease [Spirochaetaceae bacterium]
MTRVVLMKRPPMPGWTRVAIPVAAVIVTLIITAIPILFAGANLWQAYRALVFGALGTRFNFFETLLKSAPLVLTGLAVAFAFRAKFWNIGAEGQLLAGGIVATWLGIADFGLPAIIYIPMIMVTGFVAGALWASIPAILKTKLHVDDVVSTLLLNFVMIHIMGALLFGPLQNPEASWPVSAEIAEAARYPQIVTRTRFHIGIPFAYALVLVVWFINAKTVLGYRSQAVGVNLKAARFGGIPTTKVVLVTAAISGGLAGLAGVGEVAAVQYKLLSGISPGYGYTGIVIAMLGNLHPVGVFLAALFFSIINVGSQTMSRMAGIPSFISGVMEGVALMVMLVFLLLNTYRFKLAKAE